MKAAEFQSAAEARAAAVARFRGQMRQTCRCSRLELRQESTGLVCASCGSPLALRNEAA